MIDADLGSGIIKQRLARRGEGKSGGFRSIIVFRSGEVAFFVYGFSKSDRDNIAPNELGAFKALAKQMLDFDAAAIEKGLATGALHEVDGNEAEPSVRK